jgi:hypothetical protein
MGRWRGRGGELDLWRCLAAILWAVCAGCSLRDHGVEYVLQCGSPAVCAGPSGLKPPWPSCSSSAAAARVQRRARRSASQQQVLPTPAPAGQARMLRVTRLAAGHPGRQPAHLRPENTIVLTEPQPPPWIQLSGRAWDQSTSGCHSTSSTGVCSMSSVQGSTCGCSRAVVVTVMTRTQVPVTGDEPPR